MRASTRHFVREGAIWIFVIAAGFGSVYLMEDGAINEFKQSIARKIVAYKSWNTANPRPTQTPAADFGRSVTLHAGRSGHFAVKAWINGREVDLLADTGASLVVLTHEAARKIGLPPLKYNGRARTANGVSKVALVTLNNVRVGDIELFNVKGMVAEPGKLHKSLLGMSFIGRLKRFELRGRELVLVQ